jgi:hypothetical protein
VNMGRDGDSSPSRVTITVPVELTSEEVKLLLREVTYPGRVSTGPNWSNSEYFLHFFEAWTSRNLHRVRRLRWRKSWMPFVNIEVREVQTGAEILIWCNPAARRRIGLGIALFMLALWGLAATTLDSGIAYATVIAAAFLVAAAIIADSPRAEVGGVARVLQRLLIRTSIEQPASVRSLLMNRMWIP